MSLKEQMEEYEENPEVDRTINMSIVQKDGEDGVAINMSCDFKDATDMMISLIQSIALNAGVTPSSLISSFVRVAGELDKSVAERNENDE